MADLPPAYRDADDNNVPSYSHTAEGSNQWRVVTSLNLKKRFLTIAPLSEAGDREGSGLSSYRLSSAQPLEFQARGFPFGDPRGNCFDGANGPIGAQQLLVAQIQLSKNHSALGDIAFVETGKDQNVFVDAKDIFTSVTSNSPSQDISVFLTYHEASETEPLPIWWRVEPKTVVGVQAIPDDIPAHEEKKKKSFWHLDSSKHKEKKLQSDPMLERQISFLNSTLQLCDDDGRVYATFDSDIYTHKQSPLPKGFERVSATHRSWGTISIPNSAFLSLRSQNPFFEKWSDSKMEQLVLISLAAILEINLRVQGGSEGKAFVGALKSSAVMGSVLGAEGLLGLGEKAVAGISRSAASASWTMG